MDRDENLRPGETTQEWVVRMAGLTAVERLPRELHDAIDAAADRAGYSGGGGAGTLGRLEARRTRWSWPAGHGYDPATAAIAARAYPSDGWTVHTDDDPTT